MNPALFVLALISLGQEAPQHAVQEVVTPAMIERAVQEIGSADPARRTLAEQLLLRASGAARKAVERAAAGDNREVAGRAQALLKRMGVGIALDDAEAVSRFVADAVRADPDRQRILMSNLREERQFLKVSAAGAGLNDATDRSRMHHLLLEWRTELTAELVAAGQIDKAERLLLLELAEPHNDDGYLALLVETVRLPARIAELEKELAAGPDVAAHRRLILMHRAAGNLAAARALAEKQTDLQLELWLAVKAEDWTAAGKIRQLQVQNQGGLVLLDPKSVIFARLMGDDRLLRDTTAALVQRASERRGSLWPLGQAQLVAEQYDAAAAIWRQNSPSLAFELLCLRHEYDKAFTLARAAPGATIDENWYATLPSVSQLEGGYGRRYYALLVACALWAVGRRDDARKVVQTMRRAIEEGTEVRDSAAIESQLLVGSRRQAFADALLGLRSVGQPDVPFGLAPAVRPASGFSAPGLLIAMYREQSHDEVASLYAACQVLHPVDPEAVFQRMEQIYHPPTRAQLARPQRQALLDEMAASGAGFDRYQQQGFLFHLSRLSRLLGEEDRAYRLLERAANYPRQIRSVGISLRRDDAWSRRDWPAVLAALLEEGQNIFAEDRDAQIAAALFHLGRDKEARARLTLGTPAWPFCAASFYRQGQRLAKASRPAEADERFDLALRLLAPGDRTANYARLEWHHSLRDVLPLSAARAWRRHVLLAGSTSLDFRLSDYLQAAAQLHLQQVRNALDKDELETARTEASFAQSAAQGDVKLSGELVKLFERAGQDQLADEIAQRTERLFIGLIERFPESALHHHLLARLAVLTNRRLDGARSFAARAIAIDPDQPDFYGTLAEIELTCGNRATARAAALAGLKLDANHPRCAAILASLSAP